MWGMWTTFQRLTFSKICCIGKDIGGFVTVGFSTKMDGYDLRRLLEFKIFKLNGVSWKLVEVEQTKCKEFF
jgi:hypothetical protein